MIWIEKELTLFHVLPHCIASATFAPIPGNPSLNIFFGSNHAIIYSCLIGSKKSSQCPYHYFFLTPLNKKLVKSKILLTKGAYSDFNIYMEGTFIFGFWESKITLDKCSNPLQRPSILWDISGNVQKKVWFSNRKLWNKRIIWAQNPKYPVAPDLKFVCLGKYDVTFKKVIGILKRLGARGGGGCYGTF